MHQRPVWGVSAWGGFVCALLALSSMLHGAPEASAMLLFGALALFGWAAWLSHREH
jgi:hypothetical protein